MGIFTKALYRPLIALRHHFNTGKNKDRDKYRDNDDCHFYAKHIDPFLNDSINTALCIEP